MINKTILLIHQSAELYGSDKTLFYLAKSINESPNLSAIVVIPNEGPLKVLLENNNVEVVISPIIKVSRSMFTFKGLLYLPFNILKSVRELKEKLNGRKIDIIHSNTLAVLLGAFYAKKHNIKHLWHIHEIIKKPKIVSRVYPVIVDRYSDIVVYNSVATKEFLTKNRDSLINKSVVVLNGLDRDYKTTPFSEVETVREKVFKIKKNDIVLGQIGRINNWKGQELLLDAFSQLQPKYNNLKLMFIGSAPPNKEYFIKRLQEKIINFNLEKNCKIIPFQNDIWKIWDSIDIAVIPSTEPEPFGLVAVEAMLAKKPVIAANHGGLKEIVIHNKTGLFFKPKDKEDLIRSIKKLIVDKKMSDSFGNKGYERAIEDFSLDKYCSNFFKIYET